MSVRNRSLLAVVGMLVVGMVFAAGIRSGRVGAQAQASLKAAVVSGSCDSPGDVAGQLRDLVPASGGVLTSFTRVDLAIAKLTGGGYAILVTDNGSAAACGDISGTGSDVYVAVTSRSNAGYGGIAWLHARDPQTQVSLFVSQGLGGASSANTPTNPEPPSDTTPQPPAQNTPKATSTRTPQAKATVTPRPQKSATPGGGGQTTTYTSPTFGYTMTYDATWTVVEAVTNPTSNGPQDLLHLSNKTSAVYLFTNYADETFPMNQIADVLQGRLTSDSSISNVSVRVDSNGNQIRSNDANTAIVAFNLTWTAKDGTQYQLYDYYHCYRLTGKGAVLIFLNEGLQQSYDQQAAARQKLENTITLP